MTVHTPTSEGQRAADHSIEEIFLNRWSPRAFDGSDMPEADLRAILEAARWAPSAFNVQPWRFIYALRGDENWDKLLDLLNPFNKDWAKEASALVYLFSDTLIDQADGEARPASSNSFDAGAAWGYAALQATSMGYFSHGLGGIMKDELNAALNVPERFQPEIGFAIGRRGDVATLPEGLQAREMPSPRKSLDEIAFAGSFKG